MLRNIKDSTRCAIENVLVWNISVPNKEHYIKLDKSLIDNYKDYNYPIGIFVEDNGKFRLIDGYHRYHAVVNSKKKECNIIVLR